MDRHGQRARDEKRTQDEQNDPGAARGAVRRLGRDSGGIAGCRALPGHVEWDGTFWDSWLWLDVYERPAPGGWVNSLVMEEYQVVHPTLESLWRADAFEPLLE